MEVTFQKENLYSHFQQALEEAKNVAKDFSINSESKLKNETRELVSNKTTRTYIF